MDSIRHLLSFTVLFTVHTPCTLLTVLEPPVKLYTMDGKDSKIYNFLFLGGGAHDP